MQWDVVWFTNILCLFCGVVNGVLCAVTNHMFPFHVLYATRPGSSSLDSVSDEGKNIAIIYVHYLFSKPLFFTEVKDMIL